MGSAGVKQRIIETVQQLPDDATVEDAIERLCFVAKIEQGLAQSDTGEGIAHEDIKKRFAK
jgi:predicted transcriptional regulator